MKILLTGGTGFVGEALALALARDGNEVATLVRPRSIDDPSALAFPGRLIAADLGAVELDPASLKGFDAIIHLAGEPIAGARWTPEVQARIRGSRVEGTRGLVAAISKLPAAERPRTLLSASAVGYYGDRSDERLEEASAPGQDFLAEVVQGWEAEVRRAREHGLRTLSLRFGIILGKGGGALEKMLPIPLGNGRQWMSWVHLEDIIGLFKFALMHAEAEGVWNATSPEPVTNREFTQALAHARGWGVPIGAPAWGLRAALGKLSEALLSSQRAFPIRAEKAGFRFRYPRIADALAAIYDHPHEEELTMRQFVPREVGEVFPFFSRAENLEVITPPWLNFHIVKQSTPEIGEQTLIDYRLKIRGLPLAWRSRIEEWNPGVRFVDTQVHGPYRTWRHVHDFEKLPGGTLVSDRVRYQLRGGALGQAILGPFVKNDVRKIFGFRQKKLAELFGH